jgi:beta-glucosidase
MTGMRFPFADRRRLWGVAVSHYQVEGGDVCDWTDWEARGRTRGGTCGDAVGAWTRYEDDAALAASIGANAFRFSVSWSRVEPRPGEFDDAALARYVRLVERLNDLQIEPIVTLFHYTHPTWFHSLSPWTSASSVDRFARFARRVAEALGARVRMYMPLNEPLVFLLAGYLDAQIPPGLSEPRAVSRAFDNLMAAHVAAAAAIREVNPQAAVGIAHNMMAFLPARRWNPLDRLLARTADRCYNRGVIEAFATGRWNVLLPPATRVRGRRDDLPGSLDVFGVNFYSRMHLRCPGRVRAIGDFIYRDRGGRGLTDNGWEIAPEAFGELLDEARSVGKPIIISENGLADASDRARGQFLESHVAEIEGAIKRGVPIHGYLHWSLLDNYEWLDGFGPKFGLFGVDRTTMERHPRPSAAVFQRLGQRFLAD